MEDVSKYGIINPICIGDSDSSVQAIESLIEKPDKDKVSSNLAIMGRYVLTPEIFNVLETVNPGKGGEIQLTDAIEKVNRVQQVLAYNFTGERYDIGDKLGFVLATIDFALNREDLHKDVKAFMMEKIEQSTMK